MIQMPRRSVTRFFIPLIDVLTLMFCIYLLMPIIKPVSGGEPAEGIGPPAENVSAEDWQRLKRERDALRKRLAELQQKQSEALQQRLAVRVLQIGDEGKLYFYDARRPKDRRIAITADNVQDFLREQKKDTVDKELYVLILYPRVPTGNPVYPLQSQREEYDRWFQGVAHGYDVGGRE
jgi:hypothetical protein